MKLSIIIPVFNEERRIKDSLTKLLLYLQSIKINYEIIVVNDGSTDTTLQILKEFNSQINVLKNASNKGKGYSIKKAILRAKGDIILFMDADLSTPLENITEFLNQIKQEKDIVIGSRNSEGAVIVTKQPLVRQFMGKIFAKIVRLFFLPSIHDSQCGFKMFKTDVAKRIISYSEINNFTFDVEFLFIAQKMKFIIKECPVYWTNRGGSSVKLFRDPIIMFFSLIKILISSFLKKY